MAPHSRQDDASMSDDTRLFRRVHPKQIVPDEDTGLARVSTGAFKDAELSFQIESILRQHNLDPAYCLKSNPQHSLVSILAGQCRQLAQIVCQHPLPLDPAHGLVLGKKTNHKILDGLREAAQWVIPPTAPAFPPLL